MKPGEIDMELRSPIFSKIMRIGFATKRAVAFNINGARSSFPGFVLLLLKISVRALDAAWNGDPPMYLP